ncbi:hypothetical protein KKF84_18510 [Myxococcota bacterium]|nr:hypothetical protein [Myxococcota bacterium]MBU1537314.1 hypothetical protein [Myxococcota bacterium]
MKRFSLCATALIITLSFGCKKKSDDDKAPKDGKAKDPMSAPAKDTAKADLKGADGDWDKIIAKGAQLVKVLKATKTLDDVKKNKDKLVSLQVEMFKMNMASAKTALKLDKAALKAFMDKAAAANAKQAKMQSDIVTEMGRIAKIEGVKEIQAQVNKETAEKMTPLLKEFQDINKQIQEKLK